MTDPALKEWDAEMRSKPMVKHALAYARKGWRVIPLWWPEFAGVCACPRKGECDSVAKHPLVSRGIRSASVNPKWIRAWWERWPLANIGIATGPDSGFFVLDVDGPDGARSIGGLIAKHPQPELTVAAITGTGGRHVLWKYPEGVAVKNRVRFLPGLDIRSDGGHIVAPPSMHGCGERYVWHEAGHPGKVKIKTAPDWLIKVITKERKPRNGNGRPFDPDRPKPRIDIDGLPKMPEGGRNNGLFQLACRLVWEGRERHEVESGIEHANRVLCEPPLRDKEVEKIVGSACRYL